MQGAVRVNVRDSQRQFAADALGSTEAFVNAFEAGDFLELHPATVQRFAREGLIPAHPVAGRRRRHWSAAARCRLSMSGNHNCLTIFFDSMWVRVLALTQMSQQNSCRKPSRF